MAVECNARNHENAGYYVTCPHGRGKASPTACKKCQDDDLQDDSTVPVTKVKPATDLLRSPLALEIAVRKLLCPAESLGLPNSQGMTGLEWVEKDLEAWTVDFAKESIAARLEQLARMLMIPEVFLTHIIARFCSDRFAFVVGRRMVKDIPSLKSTPLGTIRPVNPPIPSEVNSGVGLQKQAGRKKSFWKLPAAQFGDEWPNDMSLAKYAAMRLDEAAATGARGAVAKVARKIAEQVNEVRKSTGTEMCGDDTILSFARKFRLLITTQSETR